MHNQLLEGVLIGVAGCCAASFVWGFVEAFLKDVFNYKRDDDEYAREFVVFNLMGLPIADRQQILTKLFQDNPIEYAKIISILHKVRDEAAK